MSVRDLPAPIYDTKAGARSHRGTTVMATAPLRTPLYVRYPRGIVNILGRMRGGSWLAVLLLAALVIVPTADCLLFNDQTGSGGHHSLTAAPAGATGHDHAAESDTTTDHDHASATADASQLCLAHAGHCPDKALPPGIVSLTLAALVLAAFTAVWTPAATPDSRAGGIRGPPSAPRSPDGRTVLTLFCISRR
ncbi:putative copper homeostasis (lipo)protein LpqS [Nocardia farcinica]